MDNSEWMRNGDFLPSRFDAQRDAINMLFNGKLNGHPENTVGLVSMAEGREVLATLTNDLGRLMNRMHGLKMGGAVEFAKSIQIAQLGLKYRQAKNHHQRIVAFVGSPLQDDEKELVKLAKKLKKNNVSVDVINFGENDANTAKLEAFVENVNKDGSSHLVTVPGGVGVLSDVLVSSPIFGEGAAAGGGAGGGGDFGFDPNMDPELAMALRVSMEEARMNQQTAAPASAPATGSVGGAVSGADAGAGASASGVAAMQTDAVPNFDAMTEEEQLQWALRESAQISQSQASAPAPVATPAPAPAASASASASAAAAAAAAPAAVAEAPAQPPSAQNLFSDPAFLSSVLGSLPGVDANDEQIRNVLSSLGAGEPQPPPPAEKDKDKKKDDDHMQE